MRMLLRIGIAPAAFLLLVAAGCSPPDPAAGKIPEPIITPNAPKTSNEAAALQQAEREAKARQNRSSPRRP